MPLLRQQGRQLLKQEKENQMTKPKMLSVRQFAIARGVSLGWVRALLYAERIPGAKKLGREWRIPRSSLTPQAGTAWAANNR
jgi:hypothetical protein